MTEPSTSHVEQQIAARIAAVKIRVAAAKERRDDLTAARRRGLAHRHARKLRNLAEQEQRAAEQRSRDDQDDAECGRSLGSSPAGGAYGGGLDGEDHNDRYGYA